MRETPIDTPQAKPENYVDQRDLNVLLRYTLSRLEQSRLIPAFKGVLPGHYKASTIYRLETVVRVALYLGNERNIESSDKVAKLEGKDLGYETRNLDFLVELIRSEDKTQPVNLLEHAELEVNDTNTYERYVDIVGERSLPKVVDIIKEEVKKAKGRGSIESTIQAVRSKFSIPHNKIYSLASEIIATYKRIEKTIERLKQAHPEVETATS